MEQFNWGTDDDEAVWDDASQSEERETRRKAQRIRLLMLLAAVLLLTAAGLGGYRLANQRIETATTETEQAVVASHQLVQQASQENDAELLSNLISGRDPQWVRAQQRLSREDLWFDRPVLGLYYKGAFEGTPQPPSVTLSSDLNMATVETVITYEYDPEGDPIKLVQTEIYRRGESGWLLAPLDTDYWQSTARFESPFLTATFPLADQEVGERITRDLSQMLANLCDLHFDIDCSRERFPLEIDFTLNPQILLEIEQRPAQVSLRQIDHLPAPTLIGRPTDEAGYQALFEGYSRYLLFEWLQLKEERFWNDQDNDWKIIPTATQLRFEKASPYAEEMIISPNHLHTGSLSQDAVLLCLQNEGIDLISIDASSQETSILNQNILATEIIADSSDQRFALRGVLENQDQLQIWPLDVQQTPLNIDYELRENESVQFVDHPQGARLMIGQYRNGSGETDMITVSCGERTCQPLVENLVAPVVWTPDGQFTAAINNQIFLGNEQGLPIRFISEGAAAYWADSRTLRYLDEVTRYGLVEFWEYSLGGEPELLFTAADLQEALPENETDSGLVILTALALENNRTLLFVKGSFRNFYHFVHDHTSGETALIWADREPQLFSFSSSPDGNYLVQSSLEEGGTVIMLHDLTSGKAIQIGRSNADLQHALPETVAIDWSLDSRQLLIVTNGRMMIYDLDLEEIGYWPLPDSQTGCFVGRWISDD
ncbi:MAG: hypothetical protein QNJ45_10500 [Ardenticatenaceae bacterium]|nr:hypothetical protein [Ardenticatenaceae bacterium]